MNTEAREADLYEHAKATALQILDEGRPVKSVALCPMGNETALFLLPMGGASAQECRNATRQILAQLAQCTPYFCVVTEVWLARPDGTDAPPSERPDRTEALLVQLFSGGQQTCFAMLPFSRVGTTVTHGDWQETNMGTELVKTEGSIFPA